MRNVPVIRSSPVHELRGSCCHTLSRLLLLVLSALSAVPRSALALDANALPKGAQVSVGAATVSQSGNRMDVNQASERASLNWASFNIGRDAKVQFNQPSSSSVALNRVAGGASEIQGRLSANGQVFLLNPSGVLFSKTSQVNVGGLVASSLRLSDEDFMAGRYRFTGVGKPGSVVNQGELIANREGYLALLAPQVSNEGVMSAQLGTVALGAGNQVTLKFEGKRLLDMAVDQGALNSLAQNKQLIQADGGQVLMTAAAAEQLAGGVVNNVGIVRARSIENRDGKIVLLGDMKTGKAEVGGTLDASAPEGGRGGFIDTSAATVQIADDVKVTTQATPGQANGTWLIDPADFTIAASGGNISGATLSSNLGLGNVTLLSSSGSTGGSGNINVNDTVGWSANTLTLTAAKDININAVMTASGASKLVMNTATANGADVAVAGGLVKVGFNADGSFKGRVDFSGRSGTGFLTINGSGYTVIKSLGAQGSTTALDLQGMNGNKATKYALGSDIDATATSGWNSGAGFSQIGTSSSQFTGILNGLGHTAVSRLKCNT